VRLVLGSRDGNGRCGAGFYQDWWQQRPCCSEYSSPVRNDRWTVSAVWFALIRDGLLLAPPRVMVGGRGAALFRRPAQLRPDTCQHWRWIFNPGGRRVRPGGLVDVSGAAPSFRLVTGRLTWRRHDGRWQRAGNECRSSPFLVHWAGDCYWCWTWYCGGGRSGVGSRWKADMHRATGFAFLVGLAFSHS